jgi:hypoxanthine phosphoribosyltransferase
MKILHIYANALLQKRTFITWKQLEKYLDIIVEKIKLSGQHYDAIIGIKTGGAILSDYISQKLKIPNYKVKLSRKEYNCNKKEIDTIDDMLKKRFFKNDEKFTVCEMIDDDLQGKNVILIDEIVSSGKTMSETIRYLKNEKNVNIIYPTTISLNTNFYNGDIDIDHIISESVFIWPWGYDN